MGTLATNDTYFYTVVVHIDRCCDCVTLCLCFVSDVSVVVLVVNYDLPVCLVCVYLYPTPCTYMS